MVIDEAMHLPTCRLDEFVDRKDLVSAHSKKFPHGLLKAVEIHLEREAEYREMKELQENIGRISSLHKHK